MYLEKINSPKDIKNLTTPQLEVLAKEMRDALFKKLSIHGGHCGPNFGMVEATIALHRVFDSPKDKFVFDVSHQTYPHKMLTGRNYGFLDESRYDDITGYSCPQESEHDFFTIGHTSTSVTLACGLAKGRDLNGGKENIVAIIGDGSLSGGEALEGLDFASELNSNLIIVVNDNGMSIAENHGGLYKNLQLLRETNGEAQCNLFKAMGLDYVYVGDGNNVKALVEAFQKVKDTTRPVVVHINTVKGKGYKFAEEQKERFHWGFPFVIETGETKKEYQFGPDFGVHTAQLLLDEMQKDPAVVALTAGTPGIWGWSPEMRKKAGKQFVDVGIAEETAVAMSSAIAKRGAKPVFGVHSSFIQRTYDQLSQDLCINNNAASIIVFGGTITGLNDVTHLGFYDITLLCNIPNMVYLAPTCKAEYDAMLRWSIHQTEHPVAIRVPNVPLEAANDTVTEESYGDLNRYQITHKGSEIAILGLGGYYALAQKVAEKYKEKGIDATVINPRFITGLDTALLQDLQNGHHTVITLEDGQLDGGWGEKIARFYGNTSMKVRCYGARKEFVDRFDYNDFLRGNHLTAEQIAED